VHLHPDCKIKPYDEPGMLPRDGRNLTENRYKNWVQSGCGNTSRRLLWALNQAIRAVIFQVITSETSSVTAEVASSSLVVPASFFNNLQRSAAISLQQSCVTHLSGSHDQVGQALLRLALRLIQGLYVVVHRGPE
jgi:hypothetical protein